MLETFVMKVWQEKDVWCATLEESVGVTSYGASREKAIAAAQAKALRRVADRLERGEMDYFHSIGFAIPRSKPTSTP